VKKFLVIQTAFIGDAILATPVLEKLQQFYPDSQIDLLIRKGNESLFKEHPFLKKLHVWDKNQGKYRQLLKILMNVRKERYDYVINLQRFATTGWFSCFSKAKTKIGFTKNPFYPLRQNISMKMTRCIELTKFSLLSKLTVFKQQLNPK
jgi:heptosyltransferase-2